MESEKREMKMRNEDERDVEEVGQAQKNIGKAKKPSKKPKNLPFGCTQCDYKFASETLVTQHFQRVHINSRHASKGAPVLYWGTII